MSDIDLISKIKRENLDKRNYFKSLIIEAQKNQMITEKDITNLQIQILELLDERVQKYNGENSSSIRKEIMEEILESNNYTISICLKKIRNPDKALESIIEKGLKTLYYEGRKDIDKMLNIIRIIYLKVKQNKLSINNDVYNDTIIGGISGFLKIYDADFKAYDMKITADYPLYNNLIGKLEGVEFIKEYLNSIFLENLFCSKFSENKLEYLLYGYSHDYKELIINIFEIVLFETIACKIVNRDIKDLTISKSELNTIYLNLKNKTRLEIIDYIEKICTDICNETLPNNVNIKKYISQKSSEMAEVIFNASNQNTLDKIFITQKFL